MAHFPLIKEIVEDPLDKDKTVCKGWSQRKNDDSVFLLSSFFLSSTTARFADGRQKLKKKVFLPPLSPGQKNFFLFFYKRGRKKGRKGNLLRRLKIALVIAKPPSGYSQALFDIFLYLNDNGKPIRLWVFVRTWGKKGTRLGRNMRVRVESCEDGMKAMEQVKRRRKYRGYEVVKGYG
jgi:hypothetical protein